jgi:tetratricopeptide (TPR) repeat protein
VAQITFDESHREIKALWEQAQTLRRAGEREDALGVYEELLAHPCAHHRVIEHDVLDEMHQVLRQLGRFDEAIQAKRDAIAAGYRSSPDPEADIAEALVEAGRRDEADGLFAELRERDPDDVWLYNSAGYIYAGVDDAEALRWLLDGIDVAIATGDYDQVIGQLLDMTLQQWERLGLQHDADVIARVESFQSTWARPLYRPNASADLPPMPELRPCAHCGFDPDLPPSSAVTAAKSRAVEAPMKMVLSLAWFPVDEWQLAMERWPDLLDELPVDHGEYSRRIEARLKWMAKLTPGQVLTVSPLSVNELDETEGEKAGSGEGRSHLAAEIARTGRALSWPPSRNDACWCGSGHKYKKCCGPTPPAED